MNAHSRSQFAKHSHKWTEAEMRELIGLWIDGTPTEEIASRFGVRPRSITKIAGRLRREGIPLPKRNHGHIAGRFNKPWTQEEVEYLVRRRNERANAAQIAEELDRTHNAVANMIYKLRTGLTRRAMARPAKPGTPNHDPSNPQGRR
jgi:hypothetical protein